MCRNPWTSAHVLVSLSVNEEVFILTWCLGDCT